MSDFIFIPQGEQTVTVELTMKEAMALTGYRFNQNSKQLAYARSKLKKALDRELLGEAPLRYEELAH